MQACGPIYAHGTGLRPYVHAPATVKARNGPTEFALGTHRHARDGAPFAASANASFAVGAGSLILADYRTMHRGSRNQAAQQDRTRMVSAHVFNAPRG